MARCQLVNAGYYTIKTPPWSSGGCVNTVVGRLRWEARRSGAAGGGGTAAEELRLSPHHLILQVLRSGKEPLPIRII